jgi:hypothetical protein
MKMELPSSTASTANELSESSETGSTTSSYDSSDFDDAHHRTVQPYQHEPEVSINFHVLG